MSYLTKKLETKTLSLKNRLVMPPMATAKANSEGEISQDIIDYYDEKSKGGYISLITIEHSYIEPSGKASNNQLSVANDDSIDGLRKLSSIIHRNGSKTVMQINHAGSATSKEVIGTDPFGPSAVAHPRSGSVPQELTHAQIKNIIKAFQASAGRVKDAGFDGVEIHSAHGYLLNQFYSPVTNKRTDEYGGEIHNRIRIHLEVIKAVRDAVGNDFPILLRLGAADFIEGGTTLEDSKIAAKEFEKAGVNILDISGGLKGYSIPGLTGQGFFSDITKGIKEVVSIPIILTGGVTEAQAADQLLSDGKADLIGVGRAILKDSNWAKNAIEGLAK